MQTCIITGCENNQLSRGLCSGCYGKHRRQGTLEDVALPRVVRKVKEVVEKEDKEPEYKELEPVSTKPPIHWTPGIHVFTSAQNNTPLHTKFFSTLEGYCKSRGAKLHVIPIEHHPHGKAVTGDIMWHPDLAPYLLNEELRLSPDLVVYPTMPVIPTAVRPLSSLGNFGGGDSFIIGHQKVAMESIATPQGLPPKFAYTTGSLTVSNYSASKAGRRAEFHHTICALVAEVSSTGEWWVRQLHWSARDGVIHDLGRAYREGSEEFVGATSLVLGDIHEAQLCNKSYVTVEEMIAILNPKTVAVHDVFDMLSQNPHEVGKSFSSWKTFRDGTSNVERELEGTLKLLNSLSELTNGEVVLPYSNHHEMLTTWLDKADFRDDPENAKLILKLELMRREEDVDLFRWWLKANGLRNSVKVLSPDEGFIVEGVELGQHGHLGANGARGNPLAFARLGMKSTIGHIHSAGIFDGCYVAGVTGKLKMGYTRGLSSWSHSHVVQHPGGKRQIVTLSPTHKWCLNEG